MSEVKPPLSLVTKGNNQREDRIKSTAVALLPQMIGVLRVVVGGQPLPVSEEMIGEAARMAVTAATIIEDGARSSE